MKELANQIALVNTLLVAFTLLVTGWAFYLAWRTYQAEVYRQTFVEAAQRVRNWAIVVADAAEVALADPSAVTKRVSPILGVAPREYLRNGLRQDLERIWVAPPPPQVPSSYESGLLDSCEVEIHAMIDDWRLTQGVLNGGGATLAGIAPVWDAGHLHERVTLLLDRVDKLLLEATPDGGVPYTLRHPCKSAELRKLGLDVQKRLREWELQGGLAGNGTGRHWLG